MKCIKKLLGHNMDKIILYYNKETDVLDLSSGKPKKALCEETEDDLIIRKDPKTKKIIGFTVLNFQKRFENSREKITLKFF
ncbi:MAG: hypothetical protein AB1467_01495 [Candidatus Diapherotrites archaeon]